ncbi:MAG: glycosyltransferase family 2 protein [Candidatus Aminicenantes bacterium]|nr:glycosyltransferase family 2 protein [Candidatus Aminicenantes bacterium]
MRPDAEGHGQVKPRVSIVILTKNSLGVVERLLEALGQQEFTPPCEYIFMDNDSSDGTREYLQELPLPRKRVIAVATGRFSHSGTRMEAAGSAAGDVLVFFTDDVVPIGRDFLERLTAPVLEGRAAAAYGVWQIHPRWHDPVDAYLHNGWHRGFDEVVEPISAYCWKKFPPELRRRLSNFDNCASCIDRRTLLEVGFPAVPYGEDMLFARALIRGGRRVAQAKEAMFYHWHKVSPGYMFRRMCYDSHLSVKEFDIYYVTRLRGVIKAIVLRALQRTWIAFFKVRLPLAKKFYWSWYNARTLAADFFGKFAGILTEETASRGFSPLKRRLYAAKRRIVEEIEEKSILRY